MNLPDYTTCSIGMHFLPEDLEKATQLLVSTIGRTEAKVGCLECLVARDATTNDRIRYSESWNSESAFQRHICSEEFRIVLLSMELCCEAPQVIVGNLTGSKGIAYFEELRGARRE